MLVSCVASRPSRPFSTPLPRISWTRLRRQSSFLWTPGVGCLRVWGVQLTFPGCPRQNEPGWAPPTALAPALSGAFCLGVCGECFCVLAPRRPGCPPRVCPPGDPSGRAFPSACGPRGWSGGREWGGRAERAPRGRRAAESAAPVVSSAHYRGRVVDVAVVRAYAAGWPGSGARDLRGGCGSRPFSNLIGLVVMWSAEASTITRGMFS